MSDWASYREIVRNGNFIRFWLANITSDMGYGLFELAIVWLALSTTGSPLFAGTVLFVEFATYSLTFVVGPVIDASADKKKFVTWLFPVQAILAILLTFAVLTHVVSVPLILLVVFLMALLWDFPWLAYSVILPLIIRREQLLRANSLMMAVGGGSGVLINAMGGVALAVVGVGGASAIYATSFLLATVLMLSVSVPGVEVSGVRSSGTASKLVEGWRELVSGERRDLRAFFYLSGVQGFFSIAPFLLIAVISAFYIGGGNGALNFGLFNAALFAGGFTGNFIYGRINPSGRLGISLMIATLLEGVLLSMSPLVLGSLPALYALWFFVGSVDPLFYTGYSAFIQATVETGMLGRMKGNIYLFRGIGRGTGNVVLGGIIAVAGYTAGSLAFGIALILIAVFALITSPSIRNAGYH